MALPHVDDGFDRARAALQWWTERGGAQPTSSLTGGGAVAELEHEVGKRVGGLALALPSGSSAIITGLRVLANCVQPSVALVGCEWFGATGLVHAAGGVIVGEGPRADIALLGAKDELVWTSSAAMSKRSSMILVDAANLASERYHELRGAEWDAVVFSFGPGKPIDAGEGGVLVLRNRGQWLTALRMTQHPLRQQLNGIEPPLSEQAREHIHPVAALIALHHLVP